MGNGWIRAGRHALSPDGKNIIEFYLGLSRKGKRKSYREAKHYKRRKRWLG